MRFILYMVLIWAPAGFLAFGLVKVFKIGPIIYTLSAEQGLGVHSGDFLAAIPLALALGSSYLFLRFNSKAVTS